MNAVEAALGRCVRDARGQLKLSWLWADPRKARNQLSAIVKRGKLGERVTILRGGKGIFAPEEVARQVAGLIQPELLWRAPDAAQDVVVPGVAPEQEVTIPACTAEAADLGQQLSALLGHPVNFRLRSTPANWLALVDITMIFTGLDINHAGEAVRHLLAQYPELHESIVKFKFPGRGQRPISVAPLAVALQYAFLLPGKAAAQTRRQAATLVVRYLGGDVTLVDEVYSNRRAQESLAAVPAEQMTPLQQVARMCGEAVETRRPADPRADYHGTVSDGVSGRGPAALLHPGHSGANDRGGRRNRHARLAEHRKTYGNGAHMELCAPEYGHVETLWHRQIRPHAVTMELSRVPDFIVELHKIRHDLQLENISQATPKKRTREAAEEELAIAEIDAILETEAESDIYRQDGRADAIRALLARSPR